MDSNGSFIVYCVCVHSLGSKWTSLYQLVTQLNNETVTFTLVNLRMLVGTLPANQQ